MALMTVNAPSLVPGAEQAPGGRLPRPPWLDDFSWIDAVLMPRRRPPGLANGRITGPRRWPPARFRWPCAGALFANRRACRMVERSAAFSHVHRKAAVS